MNFWRRLTYWFRRDRFDSELDGEVDFHLDTRTEELMRTGMAATPARNQARREFGNTALSQEQSRDPWTWQLLDQTLQALRHGFRTLRLNPAFALVAIGSLALGIGANTAIFQLLNAVRLRSLPVANPQELVEIKIPGGTQGFGENDRWNSVTYPLWEQIRDHQQAFSSVFAWGMDSFLEDQTYTIDQSPPRLSIFTNWASGNAFETLGVKPYRGRLISPADEQNGCASGAAVISYGFWQRELGGKESAVGARLAVAGKAFTITGITPPKFYGLEVGKTFDLVLPTCAKGLWGADRLQARNEFYLGVMGRLKPGWTVERAATHLRAASAAWFEAVTPSGYSESGLQLWTRFRLTAESRPNGFSIVRERYENSLWLLLGIAALVLTIACANLANLMLARATGRAKEIAVRMAIGATRLRVIFELCAEQALLALGGAIAGTALAAFLSRSLVAFLTTERDPIDLDMTLDARVLAFTAAVALFACLSLGLTTALFATRRALASGQFGARGVAQGFGAERHRFSFQRILIAGQISISLVLLVASLLFVRSFHNLFTADAGFRQEGIVFSSLHYKELYTPKPGSGAFRRDLLNDIRAIPGIESASTSTNLPLAGSGWSLEIEVPGAAVRGSSRFTWVNPRYFSTMEIGMISGRDISDRDTFQSPRVLVVNETFVRRYVPNRNPLGETIQTLAEPGFPSTRYQIVGVTKDTKYSDLRRAYEPIAYAADQQSGGGPWAVVTRSSLPVAQVAEAIRQRLAQTHPGVRLNATTPLRANTLEGLARERLLAWLSGFFGALAVVLAGIGLYGVISFMVSSRRNEIGIRLALGSTQAGVARLVLGQIAALVAIGLAVGAAISIGFSGAVRSLLFELTPTDPATLLTAAALLALIAVGAGLIPARRAARLNPIESLRQD